MNAYRILALLSKELEELARNRAALLPVALTSLAVLLLPFAVTLLIPSLVGEPLSADEALTKVIMQSYGRLPVRDPLSREGLMQAYVFQQFLLFFLLIPVSGSMAFAAYSVIGEKQGRTLEPLLATPLTTPELLAAKIAAALIPSLAVMEVAVLLYIIGIAALAADGVAAAIINARTAMLVLVLGPLAALVSLQLAVLVSSRVNDPRTAQQVGALIILPIAALMVAQLAGAIWLSLPILAVMSVALAGIAALLMILGVLVFEREAILTRWR